MSGIDLTQGRGKVEGASGRVGNGYSVRNAFVKTQGGQRVSGMHKMRVGSGRTQGVRVWHWVLRSDSDDSGWA